MTRYFFVETDAQGERLDGSRAYTLTFAAGEVPLVDGFWSLTIYDPERFFVQNESGRYSLGTKTSGLQYGSDGSLTIYIQHERPDPERQPNWLPAPRGAFEMTIRTYWPKSEVNDGGWEPPAVSRAPKGASGSVS